MFLLAVFLDTFVRVDSSYNLIDSVHYLKIYFIFSICFNQDIIDLLVLKFSLLSLTCIEFFLDICFFIKKKLQAEF